MRIRPVTRLALWLGIVALAAPSPALALRQVGLEETPNTKAELVQDLTAGRPAVAAPARAGAEEVLQALQSIFQGAVNNMDTYGISYRAALADVLGEARRQRKTRLTDAQAYALLGDGSWGVSGREASAIVESIRGAVARKLLNAVDGRGIQSVVQTVTVEEVLGAQGDPRARGFVHRVLELVGLLPAPLAKAEERPITVLPPGDSVPVIPPVEDLASSLMPRPPQMAEGVDERRAYDTAFARTREELGSTPHEVAVIRPFVIYYTPQVDGAALAARLSFMQSYGVRVQPWMADVAPSPYTAVIIKAPGEILPRETQLHEEYHVAVVEYTSEMSSDQILQAILHQWLGHPIGQVLGVKYLEDGRLAIYL